MAYPCHACGKSFQKDGDLHSHRGGSKLETCRKCLYCEYNFLNKSSNRIRKHMLSEHSDIACGKCIKKCFLTAGRDDHIRDVHGEATLPLQAGINACFHSDLQSSGNTLRRLLEGKVRQDPDTKRRCNEIVNRLVTFMQHNTGPSFGVREVVKGGSLGKGTSIREKVDIDLVVFMNRFKCVADLQQQHQEVLRHLKEHILHFTFAEQIHYSYTTKHSNRFSLRTDDGDLIEVDLLPACDIGGVTDRESTFQEMADLSEEARSYYSVSFVKDQVRFTKDKSESVKDVIRLVKHWKTREKLKISSYTVEIITIKEWERMGSPGEVDLTQLFRRTMTQLTNMNSIDITWMLNYRYTGNRPIVMDPANPFNNTASRINRSDQRDIERKAREVVSRL